MKVSNLLLLALSIHGCCAVAATFKVACDSKFELAQRGCSVTLSGVIEKGDANRLRRVIQDPLLDQWHYNTLVLDSLGGEVQEAILLGEVVREAMLNTSTVRLVELGTRRPFPRMNSACVSACFLVWVAGAERMSMSGFNKHEGHFGIGLHRPYFLPEAYHQGPAKIAAAQQSMTIAVRDYLRREQVPEQFIERMLERSSREVYWLHESGETFALNGRAPWFEEMMIARCSFDPGYERDFQARDVQLFREGRGGSAVREQASYHAWRQKYNACEYGIRREAQQALRR